MNFQWKTVVIPYILVLKIVGYWPKQTYKANFYSFYAVTFGVIFIGGHNLSQIIYIFHIRKDLKKLTVALYMTSTNLLAVVKIYSFVRNVGIIKQLLFKMEEYEFGPKTRKQVRLLRKSFNYWKIVSFLYSIAMYSVVLSFSVLPLFTNNWRKTRLLPFRVWFPFSTKKMTRYVFGYIYQVISAWYIAIVTLNIDLVMFTLMMFVWSQCEILCDNLRYLEDDKFFVEKFIECVKHHKAIVR